MTDTAIDYAKADFYTDPSLVEDPHSYFDFLRAQGRVTRLPHRNVMAITGYEETVAIMLDSEHFSSINAVTGPIPGVPFEVEGDDISARVEAGRKKFPFADQVVTESGQRLLARMGNIRLSEEHHGPEHARRFDYEPTYILRAMRHPHLEFDPIG